MGELARRLDIPTPRLAVVDLTARSPATRPTRRCRTCSTPARGATSASTSCPGRSATTAPPASRRTRRRHPLARRLHRERRPHLGQPQPAGLARPHLADRPRRRPVLPPRLAEPRHRRPRASPTSRSTPGGHVLGRRRARGGDARAPRPLLTAAVLDEVVAWCPTSGSSPRRPADTPDAARAAYVEAPHPALGEPRAWMPEGGRHEPPLPVRRAALRAARRPRGVPQRRGRRALAVGRGARGCGYHLDEERILRRRAGRSTSTACAPPSRRSARCGERPPSEVDATLSTQGKRFGWISAPRRPCCSRGRCTAARSPTRSPRSSGSSTASSAKTGSTSVIRPDP